MEQTFHRWSYHVMSESSDALFINRYYVYIFFCVRVYVCVCICIMFKYENSGIISAPTTHSGKLKTMESFLFVQMAYMIYQHLKVCFTWINRNTLEAVDQPAWCLRHQVVERSCKKKCEKHRQSHHQRRRCSWFYAVRKHLSTPRSGEKLLFP